MEEKSISVADLHFNFDLSKCNFELDAIQNQLLMFYLRSDRMFKQAFYTNYTNTFIQFIKDKVKLHEPVPMSIMGNVRGGKCNSKGTTILMSSGEWKKVEDIEIGDKVISPQLDGSNTIETVTYKNPFFSEDIYNVYERNRAKRLLYSCTGNHLIPVIKYTSFRVGKRSIGKRKIVETGTEEYTAQELSKLSPSHMKSNKLGITSYPIINYEGRNNCEIEPYTLGVYLGDGSYTHSLSISNMRKEIICRINNYYPFISVYKSKNSKSIEWKYSLKGELATLLKKYGLKDKRSGDKFIPKEAMLSDYDYRVKLLSGLIETDGYMRKNGSYSICTKSPIMAENIKDLVYSLGGRARISKIKKKIKKINFEGTYYNVSFYIQGITFDLCKKYKIRKDIPYVHNSANRLSIEVKKGKPCDVVGIEITGKSRWYLVNQWNVTHNSVCGISICVIHQALQGRLFNIDYICGNEQEYIEKLKSFPEEQLKHRIFLVDEDKKAVFGTGSTARKVKAQDVSNIIAVNNISVIRICPTNFPAPNTSWYGLRAYGRDMVNKVNRYMLYDLQQGERGTIRPLGMVYMPIFTNLLRGDLGLELEKLYLAKKNAWVQQEMTSNTDVLGEIKRGSAKNFLKDPNFQKLTKKSERKVYISSKLGSEFTKGECEEVFTLTEILGRGISLD